MEACNVVKRSYCINRRSGNIRGTGGITCQGYTAGGEEQQTGRISASS